MADSDSPAGATTLTVHCPDCSADIVVDAITGVVLRHTSAPATSGADQDFDELLARVDEDKERAEKRFEQERSAHEQRQRLLNQQFEDALDRVDDATREVEEGQRPESPFDLD